MILTFKEHSTITCALELYKGSINEALAKAEQKGLSDEEIALLHSVQEETEAVLKRFNRRYGK